jgi:hypothetical protein
MVKAVANKEEFLLTISPKYIPNWNKWEAFREIMQNVIDRNREYDKAEIIYDYNTNKQRIIIGNKFSSLDKKTLVLGETTKADNDELIGKYGEGYKLALLVFLRLGIRVRIRTANEVWAPSIKFSEKFGTELLTITVMPSTLTDNLIFELDGITPDDYKQFQSNCLYLNPPESRLETIMGDILLDDQFKSKLFVEGLFVCKFDENEKIRYGYNMKSRYIALDRDRQKVSSFNLTWETSRMYGMLDATYANLIYQLQQDKYNDISNYNTHVYNKDNPLFKALCALHYSDFIATHGKNVIPVLNQKEADFVKEKYNNLVPVILDAVRYEYVTRSSAYISSSKAKVPLEETPYSITMKTIKKILAGKEYKDKREELLQELLPLTRQWKMRS